MSNAEPSVSKDAASTDSVVEKRAQRERTHALNSERSINSTDSTRVYLKEIGRVPLLTGAEEGRLAERIATGIKAEEELALHAAADTLDGVEPSRRALLERHVRRGDAAKEDLTEANLRLVVSIAKRYVGRGIPLLDLIQEGNLGLMRAVEKFDHQKGFKFSTYATWWIRQSITRAIADQSRTIRIPVHMVEVMSRVRREQRRLTQEYGREPSLEELALVCDLEPNRVQELLKIAQDPLSLDTPIGTEDDSSLADFVEDSQAIRPADAATRKMMGAEVTEVLDQLSPREQEVVRLRFGLDDGRPRTLEEVGRTFGVTRERIRQIESKTLAKLRHPQRSEHLKSYLVD